MNEKPIGEALILCDQIITEAITNKKSLIGIFNFIAAPQFPLAAHLFHFLRDVEWSRRNDL
jgi:hypothetical protein